MSFSGLKDIDREVLKYVSDEELLKICSLDRKTWNEVCDDSFLRRRLSKYPGIEKYKKDNESWKQFFLNMVYYISKMKEIFKFEYTEGDFKKQYELLKKYRGSDLLFESIKQGEISLVKHSLKHEVNIHITDDYALRLAAARGRFKIVKYLVEQGAYIHARNDYALRFASAGGYYKIVKYLAEHGADIHTEDDEALKMAIKFGRSEVVKYLSSLQK